MKKASATELKVDSRVLSLASDIRPGKNGRAAARLKLPAGIMGIGYDELRQGEAPRRQRQLAFVAGASAIGFITSKTRERGVRMVLQRAREHASH